MTQKAFFLLGTLLTIATLVATIVVYPELPAEVPRHFGFDGSVNAYMPKQDCSSSVPG